MVNPINSGKIENNNVDLNNQNKNPNPIPPYLAKFHKKEWITGYLENQRVKKISSLLTKKIAIGGLNGLPFYITLKSIMEAVDTHHLDGHCHFMVGSKASDYIDNTNSSNDIDIQIKFKKNCEFETLRKIAQMIFDLFSSQSGIAHLDLAKGILKKTEIDKEFERFYILKFKSITGVKYDITLMAFSTRVSLFIHDGRRLLLNSLLMLQLIQEKKWIPILNPLKNQDLPKICRAERKLDAISPATINFPGCLRLFSYYVKGWVCKNLVLEKEITDSFIEQLRSDRRNNLQVVLKNDVDSHHKSSYGATVVLTYNILAALLRHGYEMDYERIWTACLAVLNVLTKEVLTPDLILVEEALLKGYPLSEIVFQSPPCRYLKESSQYEVGDYFIITQFESHYKPIEVVPEPVPLVKVESIAPPPKKKKKAANIRQMDSPEQWIKHLGSNRSSWSGDEINRLSEMLADHLKNTSVIKPDLKKALQMHGLSFMKESLQADGEGKYCLPLYHQLIEKKYTVQLDKKTKKSLIDTCKKWIEGGNADPHAVQKIFSSFSQKIDRETSFWMLRAFLERKDILEAKMVAQQIPNAEISSDIRLALIDGEIISDPFKAIEELDKHKASLRALPFSKNASTYVVKAFDALLQKGQMTVKKMNVLMQVAVGYQIADGQFWFNFISKAIAIQNKTAIQLFVTTVSKYNFAENDPAMFYQCLSLVFKKLRKTHDPVIKKVTDYLKFYYEIINPHSENNYLDILDHVKQGIMHIVRSGLETEEDYKLCFDFFIQYDVAEQDELLFIEKYLATPLQEQFTKVCDQLGQKITHLELSEALRFCEIIGKRKIHFSEDFIYNHLKSIIDKKIMGYDPQKKYDYLIDWTVRCPVLIDLLNKEGANFLGEVVERPNDPLKNFTIFQIIDRMIELRQCDFFSEYLKNILSQLENSEFNLKKEALTRWEQCVDQIFDLAIEQKVEEKLLKSLEFFYFVFSKVGEVQAELIKKAVNTLMKLLEIKSPLFAKEVERFRGIMSGEQFTWSHINRRLQDKTMVSKFNTRMNESFDIAMEYRFLSMNKHGILSYQVPSEEYTDKLQHSVKEHSKQWSQFAKAMICLCETLLETTMVNDYEEDILKFTAETIEILMLGSPVKLPMLDDIQKNTADLLLQYLMHNGNPSLGSFVQQMTQAAHLHYCGIFNKFIKVSSVENYFCHFILDFSHLGVLGKPVENYADDEYVLNYVKKKTNWNIHQIMRMFTAFMQRGETYAGRKYIEYLKVAFITRCMILPSQVELHTQMSEKFYQTELQQETVNIDTHDDSYLVDASDPLTIPFEVLFDANYF